jgi:phosphatidylglycerol:prolipoprotein diacylglycerol transferase
VFYGALIGGVLGVMICARRKKLPFLAYIDLFAPSLVLAHAFGRIGCFMAGCCYGCPTDGFLGVVYPANSAAPAGVPLLPTQLFESAFLFILTIVLVWILKKRRTFGTVTGWYLVLYGVWRFVIEFYRSDDRGAVGMLSTSQFIGIFMVAAGAVLLILIAKGIVSRGTLPVEEFTILEDEVSDDEAGEDAPKKEPAANNKAADEGQPSEEPKPSAKKKTASKAKDAPADEENGENS